MEEEMGFMFPVKWLVVALLIIVAAFVAQKIIRGRRG
jgi:hypothetical protein